MKAQVDLVLGVYSYGRGIGRAAGYVSKLSGVFGDYAQAQSQFEHFLLGAIGEELARLIKQYPDCIKICVKLGVPKMGGMLPKVIGRTTTGMLVSAKLTPYTGLPATGSAAYGDVMNLISESANKYFGNLSPEEYKAVEVLYKENKNLIRDQIKEWMPSVFNAILTGEGELGYLTAEQFAAFEEFKKCIEAKEASAATLLK
jgi:hypothetical protein